MGRVLRLAPGDRVIVLDGSGREWLVRLSHLGGDEAAGQVEDERLVAGEPRLRLALYQALLPREKFELVLQKGTEIGVSLFVPVITARSLVRDPLPAARLERWRAIAREAAEQSRRGRVPEVRQAERFEAALAAGFAPAGAEHEAGAARSRRAACLRLFAWEASDRPLREVLRRELAACAEVQLWIGPEGGFSEAEARLAESSGLIPVSLGPRVLRAETAGLVLAALVLYDAGELDPAQRA